MSQWKIAKPYGKTFSKLVTLKFKNWNLGFVILDSINCDGKVKFDILCQLKLKPCVCTVNSRKQLKQTLFINQGIELNSRKVVHRERIK